MVWLKRNWMLLVILLVAAGLLAGAIVYLVAMMGARSKAAKELKEKQDNLSRLVNFDPSLDDANIQKIKEEIQWFKSYTPQLAALLQPDTNVVLNLDDQAFKSRLDTTVSDLNNKAASAGVTVRAKYSFTFDQQRTMVRFPANSVPVLASQLNEIQELCEILFRSKVHSLDTLRRVRAYPDEPAGSADYIDGSSIVTNNTAGGDVVITPYDLSFRGFTAELSSVLQELSKSKVFFNVKRLSVQALEVPPPVEVLPPSPTPGRPGPAPQRGKAPATTAEPVFQTVMDEKPLRILMSLEVVKLLPAAPAAPAAAMTP